MIPSSPFSMASSNLRVTAKSQGRLWRVAVGGSTAEARGSTQGVGGGWQLGAAPLKRGGLPKWTVRAHPSTLTDFNLHPV